MKLARLKISTRLMWVLSLLVLLQASILASFTLSYLAEALEEQIGQRALQLASMIAQTPSIRDAVSQDDSRLVVRRDIHANWLPVPVLGNTRNISVALY